ncbi:MAG: EF-P beta-lysylation protein EpmB [Planctomycetes bacterium]|nr:EF-P beta-lysylation protein EpmB [Planctomycetota bacterium]
MPILSSAGKGFRVQGEQATAPWQRAMKNAIRDPRELCRALKLPADCEEGAVTAGRLFSVFAPRGYVARMRPGDPFDPLLRQVLPLGMEASEQPGFVPDPVGDAAAARTPGLLQKYSGRVLMITTGACAVHCRYCFRRHFPYLDTPKSLGEWEPAIEQIEADPTIHEVLLSGGDPFTLIDETLAALAERLSAIPHLRRLRVHTRLPIVIPQRVNHDLIAWLTGSRLTPIVVVHANHPAELGGDVDEALSRLVDAGIGMFNQAVLLRGVNDRIEVLTELCEHLADLRVWPYYLHQLDRVAGAAHFEVPEETGRRLIAELQDRLPGYAVPRYVRETPGAPHKVVLA